MSPSAERAAVTAFCSECGGQVSLDWTFCQSCGHNLDDVRAAARVAPATGQPAARHEAPGTAMAGGAARIPAAPPPGGAVGAAASTQWHDAAVVTGVAPNADTNAGFTRSAPAGEWPTRAETALGHDQGAALPDVTPAPGAVGFVTLLALGAAGAFAVAFALKVFDFADVRLWDSKGARTMFLPAALLLIMGGIAVAAGATGAAKKRALGLVAGAGLAAGPWVAGLAAVYGGDGDVPAPFTALVVATGVAAAAGLLAALVLVSLPDDPPELPAVIGALAAAVTGVGVGLPAISGAPNLWDGTGYSKALWAAAIVGGLVVAFVAARSPHVAPLALLGYGATIAGSLVSSLTANTDNLGPGFWVPAIGAGIAIVCGLISAATPAAPGAVPSPGMALAVALVVAGVIAVAAQGDEDGVGSLTTQFSASVLPDNDGSDPASSNDATFDSTSSGSAFGTGSTPDTGDTTSESDGQFGDDSDSSTGNVSTTGGARGGWVAQLASVEYSAGQDRLDRVVESVRADIDAIEVIRSDHWASLRPGYWVVISQERFSSGIGALNHCEANGRVGKSSCIGRYLSSDSADFDLMCFRAEDGTLTAACNS